jgi:choline dehydrogenase
MKDGGTFDYIVTGAGSAGCAVAGRLSEDGRFRVLLLEAGPKDTYPWIHVPLGYHKTFNNPKVNWMFDSEPEPELDNRIMYQPRGKVLGGTSSINGMLYVRGAPADYDAWASLGARGWSAAEVAPLFRRMERTVFGQDQERGREGPLHVEGLRSRHPLGKAFEQAAVAAGWRANADYNGREQEGVGPPQLTQRRGVRWSAARAYLAPARKRRNLEVRTGAAVERLWFEGKRCTGVRLGDGRTIAARETILAAGAMGSPRLLMLSGIGPGEALSALGIPVVHANDHVGAHVQEHPHTVLSHEVRGRTYNMEINGARVPLHLANWLLFRRGPVTSPYPHAVAFFRSHPALAAPDLQLMFGPFAFEMSASGVVPYYKPAVTSVIALSYPKSEGRISLRSGDAQAPLRIELALLGDGDDVAALVRGLRLVREVYRHPPIADAVVRERLPGAEIESDEALAAYVRATSFPTNHPMGSCRIGDVVDPELRVLGVEGLRVADASVMPRHVSGNINACVLMIGEKASDLIRKHG